MTVPEDGPPDATSVLLPGPWTHRTISANGVGLHVAEAGEGPLILLLHGFPQFWWTWRAQLESLAAAGFHVVAADLRGYGASDKPPRGYDLPTLSSDVAALVRALGEQDAVVVGHDWGGLLGWAVATLHPSIVRSLAVVGMPHPVRMRQALLRDPAQIRASSYAAFFQLPKAPEARLLRDDAAYVEQLMRRWAGPGFPDDETSRRCRAAIQIPGAAHSAMEWYRWAARSQTRPSGVRFVRLMARGVQAPVLQLHGAVDRCTLLSTAQGSNAYAHAGYTMRVLDGVGHFAHEETPDVVSKLLLEHAGA